MPRTKRATPRKRASTVFAPKPIVVPTKSINFSELSQAYDWLAVKPDVGLKLALEWYANNFHDLLTGDPFDADKQKAYDRGIKSKALGDNAGTAEEKDAAYRTALRLFEKIWGHRPGLPKVADYEGKTEIAPHVKNAITVIETLNNAFTTAASFHMTLNRDRGFDIAARRIHLPKTEIESLVSQTPLRIALNEVVSVAKVVSMVLNPDTQEYDFNGEVFMNSLPQLLNEVSIWAAADRSLMNKAIGKAPKAASSPNPNAPATPRATPTRINGSNIVVIDATKVPVLKGARKQSVDLAMTSYTIAELKAKLTALGGQMHSYVGFAIKTLKDAGAIEIR